MDCWFLAFLLIVVVDILTFLVLIVFKFMDSTAMHCHWLCYLVYRPQGCLINLTWLDIVTIFRRPCTRKHSVTCPGKREWACNSTHPGVRETADRTHDVILPTDRPIERRLCRYNDVHHSDQTNRRDHLPWRHQSRGTMTSHTRARSWRAENISRAARRRMWRHSTLPRETATCKISK